MNTDDERISLFERIAAAFENLFRKPDKAAESFEKIISINERHEPSLKQLERLYRAQKQWPELVDTYRRHIMAVGESNERMNLYALMGEVYENEIKDLDRSVESYSDILSVDPNHQNALVALGRLYEKVEDWNRAIDTLSHLVTLVSDRRQRVELHTRIGALYEDRLQDQDTAEGRFLEALALDANFVPAMLKLIALYKGRGDWMKAAQLMIRAEEQLPNPLEKVKMLLRDRPRSSSERLDDEQAAPGSWPASSGSILEHVGAAEPLAELYFREQRWKELEPILDMLVRKADRRDTKDLNSRSYYRSPRPPTSSATTTRRSSTIKSAYDLD